jgi:hypothetical protein
VVCCVCSSKCAANAAGRAIILGICPMSARVGRKRVCQMLSLMFAGNMGGEVSLRKVSVKGEEVSVASFSVAISNGKNGQGEDLPPTWIRVTVWRKYADIVAHSSRRATA